MKRLPFEAVKAEALSRARTLLPEWLPDGKWVGDEWVVRNPRDPADRTAKNFSISASEGVWKDFSNEVDGGADLVSLYAWLFGMEQGEACRDLAREFGIALDAKPPKAARSQREDVFRPILPVPEEAPPLGPQRGEEGRWEVRDAQGGLLLLRVRTGDGQGGKDVRTWTYGEDLKTGRHGWKPKAPPKPWPMYGLDRLAAHPDAPVVVVEGEKTAEAAERVFPGVVAVTSGSSDSARSADWSPLAGRRVTVWPDADASGDTYAAGTLAQLRGRVADLRLVKLPEAIRAWAKPGKTGPGGWDLADPAPEGVDLRAILESAVNVGPEEPARASRKAKPQGGEDGPSEGLGSKRGPSAATKALLLAQEAGVEAWKDEAGNPHLTVSVGGPVGEHREHYRLKSGAESPAGRWLASLFYREEGKALPAQAKKDVLENLIAEALESGPVYPTGRRVARFQGHVYLDLGAPTWDVVEVTPQGWRVRAASEAPVRFTRTKSMLALPSPSPGGKVEALRPFFACEEEDFRLVVAWALAALSAGREYPVLVFGGEPGAAKSTATRYARALVDPNAAPLRKCPKDEKDLFVAAQAAFALTLDNLSSPPIWLADALCAMALDTGYACRTLYTDDEESVFRVASPIILNGISEQLTRSDLADRAFSVTLQRIPDDMRKPIDELDAAFHAALPAALGGLLDVLASALGRLPHVHLECLPRMAQTAKLMAAAEPALGWEPGAFAQLFQKRQADVAAKVAEGDPLVQALEELARRQGGRWSFGGTMTELRMKLDAVKPHPLPPVWPPAANKLGEKLRRAAPQLRLIGWEVNPDGSRGTGAQKGRCARIQYPAPLSTFSSLSLFEEKKEPSQPSQLSQCSVGAGLQWDGSSGSTVPTVPAVPVPLHLVGGPGTVDGHPGTVVGEQPSSLKLNAGAGWDGGTAGTVVSPESSQGYLPAHFGPTGTDDREYL